jgi:hypothetical protein
VGFHIGGMRPRFHMQGVLFFMPSQWRIDPGDIGDRGAAERTGKPLRPDRVAGIARAILGNNRAGDKRRARASPGANPPLVTRLELRPKVGDGMKG